MKESKGFSNKNARNGRLFGAIGVAGLLCVTLLAGCGSRGEEAGPKEQAFRSLQEAARVTAAMLNVYMDARVTDVLVASKTNPRFTDALQSLDAREAANGALRIWLDTAKAYKAIALLDGSGTIVAAAPESLADRQFDLNKGGMVQTLEKVFAGKTAVSEVHQSDVLLALEDGDKARGPWTVAIAAPVKDGDAVKGALVSFVDWKRVLEIALGMKVGKTGYVFVLDKDGRTIIHPAVNLLGKKPGEISAAVKPLDDAIKQKAVSAEYEFKNPMNRTTDNKLVGIAYPKGYGKFPGLGWIVAASADQSEVMAGQPFWIGLFNRSN